MIITLDKIKIKWSNKKVVTVVAVSKGYPDAYEKGLPITGINNQPNQKNSIIFHAGTKINNNVLVTNGGRVLNITAIANKFKEARKNAYSLINNIKFKGIFYRKDIGKQL